MEINTIGNAALFNRSTKDATSSGEGSKSGIADAGSVSKQVSANQTQGTLLPPPAPVAETGPEDNIIQAKENNSGRQLSLEV